MSTKIVWETKPDDGLVNADKAVEFLNKEFQSPDADSIWFDEYFQWKLGDQNPAGRGYLTLGMAEGEVIATISLQKKRVLFNGKEYIGAEFGDAYCNDKFFNNITSYIPKEGDFQQLPPSHYLNKSIFGRIAHETTLRALNDGINILYGTPNHNALPSWVKRLGHFHFTQHNIYFSTRPTFRHFVSQSRYFRQIPFVMKQLDTVISYGVKSYYKVKAKQKIAIEKENPTEAEVNALWNATKPASGFSLIRDFLYWNYRYFTHPLLKYTTLKVKSGDNICGLVTYCLPKIAKDTYLCYLVEWMIAPGYSFDYILSEVIFLLRSEPISQFITYSNLDLDEAQDFEKNYFKSQFQVSISFYSTDLINPESLNGQPLQFYVGSTDAV